MERHHNVDLEALAELLVEVDERIAAEDAATYVETSDEEE